MHAKQPSTLPSSTIAENSGLLLTKLPYRSNSPIMIRRPMFPRPRCKKISLMTLYPRELNLPIRSFQRRVPRRRQQNLCGRRVRHTCRISLALRHRAKPTTARNLRERGRVKAGRLRCGVWALEVESPFLSMDFSVAHRPPVAPPPPDSCQYYISTHTKVLSQNCNDSSQYSNESHDWIFVSGQHSSRFLYIGLVLLAIRNI